MAYLATFLVLGLVIIANSQVNADTIEKVRDTCKAACKTANDALANADTLKGCNKVCDDAYNAAKKNGVEGVAVTSSTLLISLAVGLLMK